MRAAQSPGRGLVAVQSQPSASVHGIVIYAVLGEWSRACIGYDLGVEFQATPSLIAGSLFRCGRYEWFDHVLLLKFLWFWAIMGIGRQPAYTWWPPAAHAWRSSGLNPPKAQAPSSVVC